MTISNQFQRWLYSFLLLSILLVAFALRILDLEVQSLWVDEGLSLERATNNPFDKTVTIANVRVSDCTPPIYYMLLATIRAIAGESVTSLRLPSVWASMINVALIYALSRRLFGRVAGLSSMVLAALSPYCIWHTQAALPDATILFLTIFSVLSLERFVNQRKPDMLWGPVWFILTAAMLYTHITTLWILAFEIPIAFWAIKQRRITRGAVVWVFLAVLVSISLILPLIGGADSFPSYRPNWYKARQIALMSDQDEQPAWLTILHLLPISFLLIISSLWFFRSPLYKKQWLFSIGYLFIPLAAAQLLTMDFWVEDWALLWVILLPPSFILAGAGVAALWRHSRLIAGVVLFSALAVTGQWLFIQFTDPTFGRDGLRAAAEYATNNTQNGDVIILHDAMTLPVWRYYYSGAAPVIVIPKYGGESTSDASSRMLQAAASHDRVWFLQQPTPQEYFDPGLLPNMARNQWVQFDEQDFSSPWMPVHLDGYTAEPPIVDKLPANVTPVDICWPGGTCIVGWSSNRLVPGGTADLSLFWVQTKPTNSRVRAEISIQDRNKSSWAEQFESIIRFYPVTLWPTGIILEQQIRLPLSPAIPPTFFNLDLSLSSQPYQEAMVADSGKILNNLGMLQIERPDKPIKADALELQYKNDADFGGTVRLLGYNLPIDPPRPGHTTFIDFYWQVLEMPHENWRQWTRIQDKDGKVWVDHVSPLTMADFDMLQWRTGDLIWGHVYLPLSGQMPAGEYRVLVSLLDLDGQPVPATEIWRAEPTDTVVVGPAHLANWPLINDPPPMPHRPDIVFDNAIRLWGYDIPGKIASGEEMTISIVWQCERSLSDDYNVFIHLMGKNDMLLGQADGVPADWTRPTSSWRSGEFVVDNHTILIPEDTPAGPVDVWIGFYRPDGTGRLSLSNYKPGKPDDRAMLDFVIIED